MYIVLCLPIDFSLIAVLPLGITGAALATGISQSIGGFFPIIYFMKKNISLLKIIPTKLKASPVIRAASNGASEFMTNISSSLVSMLFNLQLFVEYSKDLLEITVKAFSLYCFTFLFSGLNTMTSAFFTALNNGKTSACISFVRTLLFQTTCILVLPQLFGPDGRWMSTACAEILALPISIYFLMTKKNEYRY